VAQLLAMPGLAILGSYIAVLFTAPMLADREVAIVWGTRIVPHVADTAKVVAGAIRKGRVCLAGCMLPIAAEVRSMLLLGASGTGKTVAIQALMHTVRSRGDRMIVADPDGASMSQFWQSGDIILNPLDGRSVRWDLLGEIKRSSDYKHLAQSILPYTGDAKADEWMRHSQVIFANSMQTWHEGQLGTSDQFLQTIAIGGESKLRLLCQGTAAATYFAEGGERMLTSIMGTLTPALEELEKLAGGKGALLSVRDWVRQGTGTIWVPYGADEIAALRGPISCWMRLGIFELLSMPTDGNRRLWFFLDELDALGRIQGLKDAMVRARKKGGCIVAGIQSIAQVRAVNGDAEAQTIVEQFGTQLVLRCGASEGGGTADFASDLLGEREIERIETSTSHSRGQGGPSTTSYRRQLERAVLPSQITQLPDLSGYLKISGRTEWLKLAYEPIKLEEDISPKEPTRLDASTSEPIDVQEEADSSGQTAKLPLMSAEGFPRMSFPWSAERVFDLTAELYGRQHPKRPPAPSLEGERDELVTQQEAYVNGWVNVVWPDFRHWWVNAAEEDRYHTAMAALRAAGLELAGYDAIPGAVWEQLQELRPAEGKRPFLNAA